jgi:hypothetical protein
MAARAAAWASRAASERGPGVTCVRLGRAWTVVAGGRAVTVRHSIGMAYLAELVANPGRAIPAVELASGHTVAGRACGADPVLDDVARARYRRQVGELREEIEDAEACADLERAARARLELERLLEALAAAAGLKGRPRAFADDTERARVAVRKAISRALASLAEGDPAVAAAIEANLVTGTRCTFLPGGAALGASGVAALRARGRAG